MVAERGVVLIVEDSPELAELMAAIVEREGFTGIAAGSAAEARAAYLRYRPVAVLLDWVLPDAPGTEVCRELRDARVDTPILMLTARGLVEQRVEGLDSGADDYLTKPFAVAEMLARIRALIRRRATGGRVLRHGDLELDRHQRRVTRTGRAISLTAKEFALLEFLLSRAPEKRLAAQ